MEMGKGGKSVAGGRRREHLASLFVKTSQYFNLNQVKLFLFIHKQCRWFKKDKYDQTKDYCKHRLAATCLFILRLGNSNHLVRLDTHAILANQGRQC